MQTLVARCRKHVELKEGGHKGPLPLPQLIDARSSQHLSYGEEIALRPNLTIKYGFILRSDLPEFRVSRNVIIRGPDARLSGDRTTIEARPAQSQQPEPKLLPGRWLHFCHGRVLAKAHKQMTLEQATFETAEQAGSMAAYAI